MWLSIIRGEQSWKTPCSHSCHRDRDIEAYRHGSLERGGSYLSTPGKHGDPWELEETLEIILNQVRMKDGM